jgi:hypothetical protein
MAARPTALRKLTMSGQKAEKRIRERRLAYCAA